MFSNRAIFWTRTNETPRAMIEFSFSGSLPCGALNRVHGDIVQGNVSFEAVLKK